VAQALPGRPLRVLDLCCGVGIVSLKLIEAGLPLASITLADLSPVLMERAQQILRKRVGAERLPPIDTLAIDLLADDLDRRATGRYDLIVTSNAFQHFPRERQAELFGQIQRLLGRDGVFVFESHFKVLRPNWKASMIEEYQARMRIQGAPEEFVGKAADHINNFHNYVNLQDAYNWLEAAEFGYYECVFRKDEIGIFAAVK
jgi:SAM-dependent methyltransferase